MIKELLELIELINKGEFAPSLKELEKIYTWLSKIILTVPVKERAKLQSEADELFSKCNVEEGAKEFNDILVGILIKLSLVIADVDVKVNDIDIETKINVKDNKLEIKGNELYIDKSKDNRVFVTVFNFGNIGSKNTLIKDVTIASNNEEEEIEIKDNELDIEENEIEIKDNKVEVEENEIEIKDNNVAVGNTIEENEIEIKDNKVDIDVIKDNKVEIGNREIEVKDNELEFELNDIDIKDNEVEFEFLK